MKPLMETDLEELLILLSDFQASKKDPFNQMNGEKRALINEFVSQRFCDLDKEVVLAQ